MTPQELKKLITPEHVDPPELTDNERMARNADIMKLQEMRTERDRQHPELDNMTYIEYYESNRKKDLSYLPPKLNKQDVRITSGLTREKGTTLVSTALNMNFVPDITAFDHDDLIIAELGDNMSDHVKKSREIENWQKKRPDIYRELIAQGDVFVQEVYVDDFREMPLDEIEWQPGVDSIKDFSIRTRLQKIFSGCAVRMVNGKKVYLASIRTQYIEDQDAAAILNVFSRERAFTRYGQWERWKNVPTTFETTITDWAEGTTYKNWNIATLGNANQVAEVMLFDPVNNRFQIYLNGTPMLPHNFPLTAISPSGDIPLAQGKFEPISDFAYSKSLPSKTKIDQEVHDETTKLMIEGMRQGRKPPKGSRGRKVYSENVFVAGNIQPDMRKDDLFDLLQSPGLNQADFSFYQLIKQSIEDKTINKAFEGDTPDGDPTYGQLKQEKQQQMLKLGLAIDGFVNLERRMTWLRLYNILQNWTKKYDPDMDATREALYGQYRKFSVNTTLENGENGIKMFRYQTDNYPTEREQQLEERDLSKKYGKEVRIVYMNPEIMRMLKCKWFIVINPTPESNDELSQLLFLQNVRQGMELFGPEAFNIEYLKQRYSILINEDYNKLFKKMDVMQMLQMGFEDPAVQNAMGGTDDKSTSGARGGVNAAAGRRKKPMQAAIR